MSNFRGQGSADDYEQPSPHTVKHCERLSSTLSNTLLKKTCPPHLLLKKADLFHQIQTLELRVPGFCNCLAVAGHRVARTVQRMHHAEPERLTELLTTRRSNAGCAARPLMNMFIPKHVFI